MALERVVKPHVRESHTTRQENHEKGELKQIIKTRSCLAESVATPPTSAGAAMRQTKNNGSISILGQCVMIYAHAN